MLLPFLSDLKFWIVAEINCLKKSKLLLEAGRESTLALVIVGKNEM